MRESSRLQDAIALIDERYIAEASPLNLPSLNQTPQKKRPLFFRPSALAAALALAVLLAVPVRAELLNGHVSNLLAPLYGGAQTELVDQIGVPVGASATQGGYTLTAEAVIGDRYNIATVFSFRRTDGGILEEGLTFEQYSIPHAFGSGGGASRFHLSEDKRTLSIVETWTSTSRLLFHRQATASFTNLMRYDPETGERVLLEEGTWSLQYALRYADSTIKIPGGKKVVEDAAGRQYTVHKILLSPIGIHIDLTVPNVGTDSETEAQLFRDFSVSLVLEDGTVQVLKDRNLGHSGKTDAATHKGDFGALFDTPISTDRIQAILICGAAFSPAG